MPTLTALCWAGVGGFLGLRSGGRLLTVQCVALAGFLAGYRGLTREAYALDLRQFPTPETITRRYSSVTRTAVRYR